MDKDKKEIQLNKKNLDCSFAYPGSLIQTSLGRHLFVYPKFTTN